MLLYINNPCGIECNLNRCNAIVWIIFFFFQAEDGIRDRSPSRGLGDVYKRQPMQGANPTGYLVNWTPEVATYEGGSAELDAKTPHIL